jgi:hypothetical protein
MSRPVLRYLANEVERKNALIRHLQERAHIRRVELRKLHEVRAWDAESTRLLLQALETIVTTPGHHTWHGHVAREAIMEHQRRLGPRPQPRPVQPELRLEYAEGSDRPMGPPVWTPEALLRSVLSDAAKLFSDLAARLSPPRESDILDSSNRTAGA